MAPTGVRRKEEKGGNRSPPQVRQATSQVPRLFMQRWTVNPRDPSMAAMESYNFIGGDPVPFSAPGSAFLSHLLQAFGGGKVESQNPESLPGMKTYLQSTSHMPHT